MVGHCRFAAEHGNQLDDFRGSSVAAELWGNEAFDASLGSSIGDGVELFEIHGGQEADDGVLTLEGCEQLVLRIGIVDALHFDLAWEGGR